MLCRSVNRIGLAAEEVLGAPDAAAVVAVVDEVVVDVAGAVDAAEVVVEVGAVEAADDTAADGGAAARLPEAEVGLDPLKDPPVEGRDDELPSNPGKAPKERPPEARICISCC